MDEKEKPKIEYKKVVYGWTVFNLFYKDDVLSGHWKLPL
jgi:hypothetical protein